MSWLRAAPVAAVLLLVVNDHVLKHAYPGFVTGKLSDVAGMIFFPVLLHELVTHLVPRIRRDQALSARALAVACVATAVVFALTKTTALGNEAYRVVWGAMQWPYRAARALVDGRPLPHLSRVVLVRDPSDLLAVPFVLVAWRAARPRSDEDSAAAHGVRTCLVDQ